MKTWAPDIIVRAPDPQERSQVATMAQQQQRGDDETDGNRSLTFEEALARLEAVVARLEHGELSLEESLAAYEEGVRLAHAARGHLDGLQGRLEQLLADGRTEPLKKKKPTDADAPDTEQP